MVDADKDKRSSQKEQFRELVAGDPSRIAAFAEEVHPADFAEWLLDLDEDEAWTAFGALGDERQVEVLRESEDSLREDLAARLSPERLTSIVAELPPDEVVDLLEQVDDATSEKVLGSVDFELARELRTLASYPPDSAGGLMTTEFVHVKAGARIGDAIKLLKQEGDDIEEGVGLFVTDEHQRPVGYVPIRGLLTNSIHETVDEVMTDAFTIEALEDQEEAANLIVKYSLRSLAVVDASGVLLGVVTSDDAQEVLEEEASEDMMRLVGTAPVVGATENVVQTRLPVLTRVRNRLPLQAVTVFGGLVTAWILEFFLPESEGGSQASDLLRYLPIVIGLSGNVGVQSSTILVRAFATGEVEEDREMSVLGSEVLVGLIIGILCGVATAVVATLMEANGTASFGVMVGAAIGVSVTWAALLGCVVPLTCRRLGIDPAVVAGPFLITLSDVSGAAIFIGASKLLLGI